MSANPITAETEAGGLWVQDAQNKTVFQNKWTKSNSIQMQKNEAETDTLQNDLKVDRRLNVGRKP